MLKKSRKKDNFKKKKMNLLTNEQQKSHKKTKICNIWEEKFEDKYAKVRDHCHYAVEYRGAVHSICNLKYSIPKEIPAKNFFLKTMIIILS